MVQVKAAAVESAAARLSALCCQTYDCQRVRVGHPPESPLQPEKASERARTGRGSHDCLGSSSGSKSLSRLKSTAGC